MVSTPRALVSAALVMCLSLAAIPVTPAVAATKATATAVYPLVRELPSVMFGELSSGQNGAAMTWAYRTGIIDGYPDGSLHPEDTLNRAQLVKIVLTAAKKSVSNTADGADFPDVKSNEWYAPYVRASKNLGLVSGYTDGKFRPEKTVSKAEAYKIISGALDYKAAATGEESFYDVSAADWFSYLVPTMAALKIESGELEGNKEMTRGQALEIVYRIAAIREADSLWENYKTAWSGGDYSTLFDLIQPGEQQWFESRSAFVSANQTAGIMVKSWKGRTGATTAIETTSDGAAGFQLARPLVLVYSIAELPAEEFAFNLDFTVKNFDGAWRANYIGPTKAKRFDVSLVKNKYNSDADFPEIKLTKIFSGPDGVFYVFSTTGLMPIDGSEGCLYTDWDTQSQTMFETNDYSCYDDYGYKIIWQSYQPNSNLFVVKDVNGIKGYNTPGLEKRISPQATSVKIWFKRNVPYYESVTVRFD